MTSYIRDPQTGKVKAQTLPPSLRDDVYVPIEGLAEWLIAQKGKYVWCGRCLCVRTKADHAAHLVIHRPDYWTVIAVSEV